MYLWTYERLCRSLIQLIFRFAYTDETLVTVTADHSHVFTIGGYPKRGNPVLGLEVQIGDILAVDVFNKTYTTLGYADGPGGLNGSRPDLRTVNTTDEDFLQQATVLLDSESHGSEDVGKKSVFNLLTLPHEHYHNPPKMPE